MKTPTFRILTAAGAALFTAALVYAFMPRPVEVDVAPVDSGPLEVAVREDGKTRI